MNPQHLGPWLIATGLFLATSLILRWPLARRALGVRLGRVGVWALDRLQPVPEIDQLAVDLAQVVRREKLSSDMRRLQGIIATDMTMSATRQLGNRLAYDWILRELEGSAHLWQPPAPVHTATWHVPRQAVPTIDPISSHPWQRPPNVETLDIGWRR